MADMIKLLAANLKLMFPAHLRSTAVISDLRNLEGSANDSIVKNLLVAFHQCGEDCYYNGWDHACAADRANKEFSAAEMFAGIVKGQLFFGGPCDGHYVRENCVAWSAKGGWDFMADQFDYPDAPAVLMVARILKELKLEDAYQELIKQVARAETAGVYNMSDEAIEQMQDDGLARDLTAKDVAQIKADEAEHKAFIESGEHTGAVMKVILSDIEFKLMKEAHV